MKWHLTCYSELILIVHNLLLQMLHLLVVLKILSVVNFRLPNHISYDVTICIASFQMGQSKRTQVQPTY